VLSISTQDYRLKAIDGIHLIPLIIYFLVLAIAGNDSNDVRMQMQSMDKFAAELSLYEWHYVKIIPLIYAFAAVHKAHGYRTHLKNQHSNAAAEAPVWLDILTWGFLINWGWSLGAHVLGIYLGAQFADKFGIVDNYITSGLISALLVYGLVHTNKQLSATIDSRELFYERNPDNVVVEKIIHCMEVEKLFLNPRLNIERMAEHIKAPYREVSAILNQHFHANFNEFINLYRINEAKRLLSDAQLLNVPINEIYVQAGFNSKSAFHRFFNRLVGISPSEFRKLSVSSMRNT
jgi:AraC-like DNA-binding protein